MKLERRPENAVNWPRAVQSSVAILGALSFGALGYGYGYGVPGGRAEVYPQSVAVGADWRAELDLTAYRLKGTAGTDTVKVGIPLAVGFLDSAQAAIDSVSCVVEGTEVGCHVDVRETPNNAWPALWQTDASVRILEVAIPITAADTALKLRFGDATVDARMPEPSWVPTAVDSANIATGDSIGYYPELSGYHKTIAWCTDPQECLNTGGYGDFGPDIDSLNALSTASLPFDTSHVRFRCYSDLTHDSTVACGITSPGDVPVYQSFEAMNVGNASYQGQDLTVATDKFSNWRTEIGWSSGSARLQQPNFYDRGMLNVNYGMMGGGERFFARGLSYVWHYFNMYWDCNQNGYNNGCFTAAGKLQWAAASALPYYWFTGDTVSAGTLVEWADGCVATDWANLGGFQKSLGEPRPMAKCVTAITDAHLLGDASRNWNAYADSLVDKVLDASASSSNQGDGTWRIDIDNYATFCPQPDSALAYNSFMHPQLLETLFRYDDEIGTYAADSTRGALVRQVTATAHFFHPDSSEWFADGYRNYFNGSNCTPDNSWRNKNNDPALPPDSSRINLSNMYPIIFYWMYNETADASWLAAADTVFRYSTTETSATVSVVGGNKNDTPFVRNPKEQAEGWYWLIRGWALRQEGS
jgi:hypothetical protein